MLLNRELSDVLCPLCTQKGGLKIYIEYVSSPIGDFSVAGAQMKLSVREVPILSCSMPTCKLLLVGSRDGKDAVFPDPHVIAKEKDD